MKWIASAAFGLEGITGRDLKHLGMQNVRVMDVGGAMFEGDFADGFRANLHLRTADRVLLVMDQFEARSFEELFQGVKAIEWEKILPEDACFPIRAKCVKSQLMSPSDVQKIGKRAMVERLKNAYHTDWFNETGSMYQVDISIREDVVTVALDSSGEPLNKRGYRTWNGEAPLRETLAAALVLQSGWHPWQPLYDPCCGTGTLLIEAAYIALNRAPGLTRSFAMEYWQPVSKSECDKIRAEAKKKYEEGYQRKLTVAGSDIDPEAIELARRHVRQAGLAGRIDLEVKDMRDVTLTGEPGVFVANPPYGERLDNTRAAHAVARQLGLLQQRCPGWTMCAFSADMGFERVYGRRANRRRRFYNGRIECEYHIFEAGNVPKGKPADFVPNGGGRPGNPGNRPAPRGDKPAYGARANADRPYGRPVPNGDRPAPTGDRPYGRPAPMGDKPYGRPAPAADRPYGRPVPAADRPDPADRPTGDRPAYGSRPAGYNAPRPSYVGNRPDNVGNRPSNGTNQAPRRPFPPKKDEE